MRIRFFAFFVGVLCFYGLAPVLAQGVIYYPRPLVTESPQGTYALKIIQLALDKTAQEYRPLTVRYSPMPLSHEEAKQALDQGDIDVAMLAGTNAYDQRYAHVPFPVDRGLFGLRVGFIKREHRNLFENVKSIEELQNYSLCIVPSWALSDVFQHSNLSLHSEQDYPAVFGALDNGFCQYLSRSVFEALPEFGLWSEQLEGLAIEPHLVLRMPLAGYFYTSKENTALARRLEIGLLRAFEDGSFLKIFDDEFAVSLQSLRILSRRVLQLNAPERHEGAPSRYSPLWYSGFDD